MSWGCASVVVIIHAFVEKLYGRYRWGRKSEKERRVIVTSRYAMSRMCSFIQDWGKRACTNAAWCAAAGANESLSSSSVKGPRRPAD